MAVTMRVWLDTRLLRAAHSSHGGTKATSNTKGNCNRPDSVTGGSNITLGRTDDLTSRAAFFCRDSTGYHCSVCQCILSYSLSLYRIPALDTFTSGRRDWFDNPEIHAVIGW